MADPVTTTLDKSLEGLIGGFTKDVERIDTRLRDQEEENLKAADAIEGEMGKQEEALDEIKTLKPSRPAPEMPDLKPFEAPDPNYNAAEAFGSVASVLGVIGSLMTRQPLTSALNAGASVMEAAKNADVVAYDKAFKEWQNNSKLALDAANLERGLYSDALQLMQFDFNRGLAEVRVRATRINDHKTLAVLRTGDPQTVINLLNAKINAANKLSSELPKIEMRGLEERAVMEARQEAQQTGQPFTAMEETQVRSRVRRLLSDRYAQTSPMNTQRLATNAWYQGEMAKWQAMPEGPEKQAFRQEIEEEYDVRTRGLTGADPQYSWQGKAAVYRQQYPWLSEAEAAALATGQIKEVRNPHTDILYRLNRITGELSPMQEGTGKPAPSASTPQEGKTATPEETETIMPKVPARKAFGLGGSVRRIANTLTDMVGMDVPFEDVEEAFSALENLRVRTSTFLAEDIEGRPSVYLLQQLSQLTAEPYTPSMGPNRAATKIRQTRDMIARAIGVAESVLDQPEVYSPKARELATTDLKRLKEFLADYNSIYESMGDELKPPQFSSPTDPGIQKLKPGARFTIDGYDGEFVKE